MNATATLVPLRLNSGAVTASVQYDGRKPWHRIALELPGGLFKSVDLATDDDYRAAAEVARKRLSRCRPGSDTYWWHRAVVAESDRRSRARFVVIPGGAS